MNNKNNKNNNNQQTANKSSLYSYLTSQYNINYNNYNKNIKNEDLISENNKNNIITNSLINKTTKLDKNNNIINNNQVNTTDYTLSHPNSHIDNNFTSNNHNTFYNKHIHDNDKIIDDITTHEYGEHLSYNKNKRIPYSKYYYDINNNTRNNKNSNNNNNNNNSSNDVSVDLKFFEVNKHSDVFSQPTIYDVGANKNNNFFAGNYDVISLTTPFRRNSDNANKYTKFDAYKIYNDYDFNLSNNNNDSQNNDNNNIENTEVEPEKIALFSTRYHERLRNNNIKTKQNAQQHNILHDVKEPFEKYFLSTRDRKLKKQMSEPSEVLLGGSVVRGGRQIQLSLSEEEAKIIINNNIQHQQMLRQHLNLLRASRENVFF